MTDQTQESPPSPDSSSYYVRNPPIEVTVFGPTGTAYATVRTAEPDIPNSLRADDTGWMRGRNLWGPDEQAYQLPEGGYAVDPDTREITLT